MTASASSNFDNRVDGPEVVAVRGSDEPGSAYRLGTREYGWHSHARGQLFCVESGLVHVRTKQGSWLLPPHRAGWVPPGALHRASVTGAASGWSVLVTPASCKLLPKQPCVVGISELMQALVKRAVSWSQQESLVPNQRRLVQVLLDEIQSAPHEPLHLPMPTHPRLVRIARAIFEHPEDVRTLEAWADWGAVSARNLRRLMVAETGLSFAQWRQQARLIHALEMLAQGQQVALVADALGYASPSNFIAMFRRAFGVSPARYFAAR